MSSSRKLMCLIEGESNTFSVTVSGDCDPSDLKEQIAKKRERDTLKDVGPQTLELWKVNIDLGTHDGESVSLLKPEGIEGAQTLTWFAISDYWPEQPPTMHHLQIIVQIPDTDLPSLKRRRVENPDKNRDKNFRSLYDLFWGQTDSSLYQTLKVNIPHPMTLEVEEGEESDFTIIKLPEGVTFPFGGSIMLVPEIYQTFWDLVVKDDADWQSRQGSPEPFNYATHSTVIFGQPGTGKSVLENNFLIRRLQGKMVTIFCDHPDFAHVFSDDGVRRVPLTDVSSIAELDNDSKCTALINISPKLQHPPRHFYPSDRKGRVVVATSPNADHLRNFSKERGASFYCMPTCDWDDLFCSCLLAFGNSTLQYSSDDCKRIREAYEWFGGIKRRCIFHLLRPKDFEIEKIYNALKDIDLEKFIRSATGPMPFANNTTNVLVNIEPVDGSGWRNTTVSLIRGKIAGLVFDRLRLYSHIKTSEFITQALGLSYSRGCAGSLFEHAVHRLFRAGIHFQPQGVTSNASPFDITIPKEDKEADGYFYDLSVRANKGSRKVDAKYLHRYMIPLSRTQESVDSVWISDFCTVFFQITASPTHAMKLHGIMQLLDPLPADATKDVRIVFILPANDGPTKDFKAQKIDRPAGVLLKSKLIIAEKVDKFPQYVHYVDLGSIN